MIRRVVLVSPQAPPPAPSATVGPRPTAAGKLRLGILDNSKPNADLLLGSVAEAVGADVELAAVVSRRKPHPAYAAGGDLLDELAKEADFVVTAMAD
jgi:hypothetical protein